MYCSLRFALFANRVIILKDLSSEAMFCERRERIKSDLLRFYLFFNIPMRTILHLIIAALAVYLAGYLIPGVGIESYWVAIVVALVLGILNAFLKPLLSLLTLPINILTLGLFSIVINAIIILLVDAIVPGFAVNGFWNAVLFSIVLWIINSFFALLGGDK